jgi:hypothetical protein
LASWPYDRFTLRPMHRPQGRFDLDSFVSGTQD